MPSHKILIALRVEPPLYERIVARARADGRSPSNYVAQYLRKGLAGEARQEAARHGPVIDTSGMFAQRPSSPPPPTQRSAYAQPAPKTADTRDIPAELAANFRNAMEQSDGGIEDIAQALQDKKPVIVQMHVQSDNGSIRDTGAITPSVDDHGQYDPGYAPDESYQAYRLQGHSREVAIERVRHELSQRDNEFSWMPPADPLDIKDSSHFDRVTPATHDIPADWVNQYGLTLVMQNALERDDNLEYGPPTQRPGVAH